MQSYFEFGARLSESATGYGLSGEYYHSQKAFDFDMEHIFFKSWIFAIPACEIPDTGNFVTLKIGNFDIVIIRGEDQGVRAFHNSCRHRGSRLCSVSKGSNPKLVCPYHQWTYELDGSLIYARDMGENFDPSQHGLLPVSCQNLAGLIYISLAEHPNSLDELETYAEKYLAPHRLNESKVAFESTIIENANWKLVIENNRECYHCSGSHPDLCRTYSDDPAITGVSAIDDGSILADHWNKCEAIGLPSKYFMVADGEWRFARMPLIGGSKSMTLSGEPAVKKPMIDSQMQQAGTLLYFNYPNSWNHFLADHAIVFRITPLSPTQTEVVTKWLVHQDAIEGVDYDLDTLSHIWLHTNDEDRLIVEENQTGINSPAYIPGPYSELHEGGVIQFLDWYKKAHGIVRISEKPMRL